MAFIDLLESERNIEQCIKDNIQTAEKYDKSGVKKHVYWEAVNNGKQSLVEIRKEIKKYINNLDNMEAK